MDQQLKKYKLLRTPIRAKVTRCKNLLEDLATQEQPDGLAEVVSKLESALSELKNADILVVDRLFQLNEIDNDSFSDLALEEEINNNAQIQEDMEMFILSIKCAMSKSKDEKPVIHRTTTLKGPKLPAVKIPIFTGDLLLWQTFWDTFRANVHENLEYSKVAKMSFLKEHLRGEAAEALQHFQITDACYDQAIDLLTSRFGRQQDVKFAHMLELLNITPATKLTDLRFVIDKVEGHLRCLSTLGFSEKENSELFTCVLLSKIPERVRADFTRRKGACDWDLPMLRQMLSDEVRALDSYKLTSFKDSGSKPQHNVSRLASTTQALVGGDGKSISCAFCFEDHYSDECRKYGSREVRLRRLSDTGSCFRCLNKNHKASECKRTKRCFYCQSNTHHSAICTKQRTASSNNIRPTNSMDHVNVAPDFDTQVPEPSLVSPSKSVLPLATAVVQADSSSNAYNGNTPRRGVSLPMRLILDVASGRSYITERAAKAINLKPSTYDHLTYASFGSGRSFSRRVPIADIEIKAKDGQWIKVQVTIVPVITSTVNKYPIDTSEFPILETLELGEPISTSPEQVELDVLIGLDSYFSLVLKDRIDLTNKLSLMHTRLGWIPAGAIATRQMSSDATLICPSHVETVLLSPDSDLLMQSVESLWEFDSLGILDCAQTTDDDIATQQFNKTVKLVDGRYAVSWPWKEKSPELKSNLGLAYGRLKSTLNKMKHSPAILSKYHETIMQQLQGEIIEEVDETYAEAKATEKNENRLIHYIPHHAVVREDSSTTRLRIVYDASARTKKSDSSLNDCLLKGPTTLQEIPGILMRFRMHPIGLVADIEKAFLQVGLHLPDRDVCRFLWPENPFDQDLRNIKIYRFRRVPFGIISSPFLLAAVIGHHIRSSLSSYSEEILSNMYVDNLISGQKDEASAVEFYSATKSLFHSANMNLRQWGTNSTGVRDQIDKSQRVDQQTIKVLGLQWNQDDDKMSFTKLKDEPAQILTKRFILHFASSVFDPLGYASPITVRSKLLTQELWKGKYGWDDPIPSEFDSEWNAIYTDLMELKDVTWPRFFGIVNDDNAEFELHAFVDASKSAYGACIYLRGCKQESNATVSLVIAKNRIAPVKEVSLPRLELMAVVIGVRLVKYVQAELKSPIKKTILWSDAKCVLHWIKNDKPKPVFVENRLKEIRQSEIREFRYVPSQENPADLLSRGISTRTLIDNDLWWSGPHWLKDDTNWPESMIVDELSEENELESEACDTNTLVVNEDKEKQPFDLNVTDFSSLQRLLNVTAWCLRAADAFRKRDIEAGNHLTADEIRRARQYWDKSTQKTYTESYLNCEAVKRLDLFEDEKGIIRCGGRLKNSALQEETKFPILLPKNNPYTKLVIQDCHSKILHQGTTHTLSTLRESYWVPSGRSQVQKVLRRCVLCRKHQGGSFRLPAAPPLPEGRVNRKWPFATTGVDYLGPLIVRSDDTCDSTKKVWICLFTCGTVRAIHLEVSESLSTTHFLHCLRRFIATRGTPEIIISDNAKQFRLAGANIERVWSNPELQSYVAQHGISWRFIVEKAPWMGGFFERLVGSVKSCLKKTLGRSLISLLQLQTLIKEIEAVINTRPLTYLDSELDVDGVLTPADFIGTKSSSLGIPNVHTSSDTEPSQTSSRELIEWWKKEQHFINMFWESWTKDYLVALRERNDSKRQRNPADVLPKIGQVVLLKDAQRPRGQWKLVRIRELHTSRDGTTRSVTVSTHNGKSLRRPLQHLIPLEYNEGEVRNIDLHVNTRTTDLQPRPPRKAKSNALAQLLHS